MRSDYGLDPVDWGDTPLIVQQQQAQSAPEEQAAMDMMKRYNNNLYKAGVLSSYNKKYQ